MSKKKDYDRGTKIARAVLAGLIALAFVLLWVRATTYRKVIYDYQAIMEGCSTEEKVALKRDIERKVGRANTPWYHLDKAPRYLHFWDEYNVYTNAQIEALTYGLED